ncbi:hypothetical protein SAMN05660209_04171 [Geodermatophilus africanus]|uniref:Uncharacterized protein n=1 Tax=Geodermatophilus africanus TaxID=1137993 RepID=A0A1H3P133_9ACTN|nr:hypothetical protein [Geodermatophilus africanus]SDY94854.1 hypothetical protein SAMN05660209_04171 [Geodermatophilus africanus]
MPTISGDLHNADYGDNVVRDMTAGDYQYTLSASDGGKLAFKVECKNDRDNWETIEEKQKIRNAEVNGHFTVLDQTGGSSDVRFNFNREFLGNGVDYVLEYEED